MEYTQQEINNYYSKYSCCLASLATDYINSLAIGSFDCGQKLDKLLQFKSYLEILACYKIDTCIINQPLIGTFGPQIDLPEGAEASTIYSFYKNEVLISDSYTIEDIINYYIDLGFGSITQVPFFQPDLYLPLVGWEDGDYDYATQVLYTTNPALFYTLSNVVTATINPPNYTGEPLYATYGDIPDTYDIVWEGSDVQPTITWGQLVLIEENCEEYTEEELNCISNEDLDTILFWLKQVCLSVKNKPTISEDECEATTEDEYTFQVNQTVIIQAGDSIEVERNGNTYTISNPLPDQEVTLTAGSNVTITGTYPNFTITSSGTPSGGVAWGAITGTLTDQTDLSTYLDANYYPLAGNPSGFLTNISATNGLTESPTNTIKLGGILTEDTIITQPDFTMNFRGTVPLKTDSLVGITTTGAGLGNAFTLNSVKNALEINSAAQGISINSSTAPISAQGTSGSSLSKTDTANSAIDNILLLGRNNITNAPSLANSGISIAFSPGNTGSGASGPSSSFSLLYEDPTDATIQTKFRFSPLGAGTTTFGSTLETFGSGKLKLNAYGINTFVGTVAYLLGVDSSGNVIETSASGGGSTDLGYTPSPTDGTVTSSTGTDATLTLATGTNAGLLAPADFTKLGNQSGTNTGDNATNTQYSGLATSKADIAGPTFTGVPAAPTAAGGTNTTQIATTAFVIGELASVSSPIASVGNGTAVTGTTANTYSKGLLIPANSRGANQAPQIDVNVTKTGAAGNLTLRIYWNTTNDLSGSPILIALSATAASLNFAISRFVAIEVADGTGNGTKVSPVTVGGSTSWGAYTTTTSILAIDWTSAGYLICAVQNASAADSSVCNMIKLH